MADESCEPLNLTMKKQRPIAIVAPNAIAPYLNRLDNEITKNFEQTAEDLSKPQKINNDCLDLTVVSKYNKNEHSNLKYDTGFPHEQLKKFIGKQDFNSDKNIFSEDTILYDHLKGQDPKATNIFKENKILDIYDTLSNKNPTTEGIYSMINTLAEQKFLTALYMNSILSQNMGYGFGYPQTLEQNLLNNQNNLLNNFVDKQNTSASQLFRIGDKNLNLETVIKNEVNTPENNIFSTQQFNKR